MKASREARAAFERLARTPERDLGLGALLIAAEERPALDPEAWLGRLDDLAAGLARRAEGRVSAQSRVDALRGYLYDELGFRGNREDYYDPRNSFLDQVLERRLGIPITLAVVVLEIARRIAWPMEGIGAPGHFLIRYVADPCIVIDPFSGEVLSDAEPRQGRAEAASNREILARMLRNLKQVYLERKRWEDALACCDRILLLEPELAGELRDRGLLWERLGCAAPARADYERFLQLAPADPTSPAIRSRLRALPAASSRIH